MPCFLADRRVESMEPHARVAGSYCVAGTRADLDLGRAMSALNEVLSMEWCGHPGHAPGSPPHSEGALIAGGERRGAEHHASLRGARTFKAQSVSPWATLR